MKIYIYLITVFLAIFFIASCKKDGRNSVGSIGKEGGEWVLKIDKLTVYQNQFEKEYDFALQMSGNYTPEQISILKNNDRAKQEFLEGLISQILVLKKADEEKFFESEEAKDFLDYAYRSIQVQHYTQKMLEKAMETVADPTQQEITAFYNQYKNELAAEMGVTELNANTIAYLSQYVKTQQAQQNIMREITDLKDKSIIERNKAVIGDMTAIPANPLMPQKPLTDDTNSILR